MVDRRGGRRAYGQAGDRADILTHDGAESTRPVAVRDPSPAAVRSERPGGGPDSAARRVPFGNPGGDRWLITSDGRCPTRSSGRIRPRLGRLRLDFDTTTSATPAG
jgi:hypothetical protein